MSESTVLIVPSTASSTACITSPGAKLGVATLVSNVITVCAPAANPVSFTRVVVLKSKAPFATAATYRSPLTGISSPAKFTLAIFKYIRSASLKSAASTGT